MTQLEIATKIFCSGRAEDIEHAWRLAGELTQMYDEVYNNQEDVPIEKPEIDIEALEERTRNRTQHLFDLKFEWNEALEYFELGENFVSIHTIEHESHGDWNFLIESLISKVKESNNEITQAGLELQNEILMSGDFSNDIMKVKSETDLFRGKDFIEFEMDKSICRLYQLDNKVKAEDDLQVSRKTEAKFIMTSGENKEYDLGITIYKK